MYLIGVVPVADVEPVGVFAVLAILEHILKRPDAIVPT